VPLRTVVVPTVTDVAVAVTEHDEPRVQVTPFTVVDGVAIYVLLIGVPFHVPDVTTPMVVKEDVTMDDGRVVPVNCDAPIARLATVSFPSVPALS
jgi:hypothetical protein